MSPRYFQGVSVHGPVKASSARTFSEVVDHLRVCASLNLTRSAFLALDKKQRNEIKQVPFFVPACFRESPSKRLYSQATVCNLIFIDIDETPDGKCPAAPFVNNPELLYAALGNLNFAAHHTASSTPEKPRIRIVVEAQDLDPEDYPRAVATIAQLLGLPVLTKESKVSVQPMFLPTMFKDSGDNDHPLFAYRLDGETFKAADMVKDIAPHGKNGHSLNGNGSNGHSELSGIDALDFLRSPVPEITLATAKDALSSVDPDCRYFDWLEIAAALKHQFSPHKVEEAYTLFDEWSQAGDKYGGDTETQAKWDSLRPTPIGRLPVTIRSLLRQAVASGWDDKKVKETCFNRLLQWMEEVKTMTELTEQGTRKILATPLLSAMQEDLLVHEITRQAKKRFAYTLSTAAIRKDLQRIKAEIKGQEKQKEKQKEPVWAKGVCYISAAQEFFRHRTGEKYKPEALNSSYSRHLLPTEDALRDAGLPITPATLSKPILSPNEYALNHLKIPAVYDYAYDPSQPTEVFFVNCGRKFVNTYSPTYPELDAKGAEEAGNIFLGHLRNLIAEPEYRKQLVDFLAFMIQCPGQKIRWAVLMQGAEGCGKTFIAEAMRAVLGKEHVKTISGESIKTGYNEWSFGHQLVALEEVRVAGANRQEIMNALKPLVTNDHVSINEKFRNQREVQNISNYMLFSNHHDALALTPGDRRYFVLKSPLQHKAQVLALGDNYFPALFKMLREKAGGLRAWFTDWQISPDFSASGHAPRTKYVQDLINDTAGDLTAAIRRVLLEGDYPLIQFDIVSAKTLIDVLRLEEGITRATAQQVAQVLREEGFEQHGRHMFGTERHYLWARRGIKGEEATRKAADREKRGVKNLCMELLY